MSQVNCAAGTIVGWLEARMCMRYGIALWLDVLGRVDCVDIFSRVSASVSTSPCTPLVKRLRVEACRQASRDSLSHSLSIYKAWFWMRQLLECHSEYVTVG